MPADTVVTIVGVLAFFAFFAGVLTFGDMTWDSSKVRHTRG